MTGIITLTSAGIMTGPFNIYSNVDGYLSAFESNLTKTQLLNGYPSNYIPNGTTIIRISSTGACFNYIDIVVPTTTTTTSSSTTSTSSTSTTSTSSTSTTTTSTTTPPPSPIQDIIEDNAGACDGYFSFKVITSTPVNVVFTSDLESIATYIPTIALPLPPTYIGIDHDSLETTSVDQGYMIGINATLDVSLPPSFISRIIVEVYDAGTDAFLGRTEFSRSHTNALC